MIIQDHCTCGSNVQVDTEEKSKKGWEKDWHKWRKMHSNCADPEPKVKGVEGRAEWGRRDDPGHEYWSAGNVKMPIVNAKVMPFGFVSNERNRAWLGR